MVSCSLLHPIIDANMVAKRAVWAFGFSIFF